MNQFDLSSSHTLSLLGYNLFFSSPDVSVRLFRRKDSKLQSKQNRVTRTVQLDRCCPYCWCYFRLVCSVGDKKLLSVKSSLWQLISEWEKVSLDLSPSVHGYRFCLYFLHGWAISKFLLKIIFISSLPVERNEKATLVMIWSEFAPLYFIGKREEDFFFLLYFAPNSE